MNLFEFILALVIFVGIIVILMMLFSNDAYGQQFQNPGDQFNNPGSFQDNNQQFSNNQYQQDQGYGNQQYGNQQFGNQYGTPTYGPQYGMQQQPYGQQQQYGGFGIQEIITALIAGGGSAAYTRRRTNSLEKDNQQLYSEVLKGKQVDAEIARITMQMNQEKANQINDAPMVKLETLQQDVQQFTDKTAKA